MGEKVRQEILKNVGASGPFSMADVNNVTYLESFVKESQRSKPTTPFNLRTNEERDVSIGGVHVPKGTTVVLPYLLPFKDPAVFGSGAEDPMGFDPNRFEGDNDVAKKRITYLTPFGGGPRMCLGFPLAKIEIKVSVVAILRRARIVLAEDVPLPMKTHTEAGCLQPVTKFKVKFELLPPASKM